MFNYTSEAPLMQPKPLYCYIAFDLFPSQKGAATHIDHCLSALQETFSCGLLICLGNDDMPTFQYDTERKLYVYRWKEKVVNFLERTQKFQQAIQQILSLPLNTELSLIHFRDIWGGIPALNTSEAIKKVFEVNSFASIELPNRYPSISKSVLQKLSKLEDYCIQNSDAIITPSEVTKTYIQQNFAISEVKVTVISNGVTIYNTITSEENKTYILYFGALQKWQGIKTLFKAWKELEDLDIRLRICASIPEKRTMPYQELADNIGVAHKIDWEFELDKQELAKRIKEAVFTVAPLTACDRNIIQGCNPLKILESMGYGIPVIASRLPVTTELITHKVTGILIPPDRPEILGRSIRKLLQQPELIEDMGMAAEKHIQKNYLWKYQENKMKNLYLSL
ncbi:glycosyltransferase family 4 protein [Ulvibacter antarcticus]|uniref:Glycosyltransferase involved in cell wall biosynthesis n=1 Tax=Ulvibacter antarcticus TaxID=442714 RepID=A0A3L9YVE6_9FLAO|nr:glycosyltransferase family 4 protein [Ulvibacter antarcticus]RMA64294.1 glycosyltransferase involved in cell wall biosynthesis [Ulvibacter antarcticus]